MRILKVDMYKKIRMFRDVYKIYDIDDMKSRHKGHFFSPENMKFFKSKILEVVFPNVKGEVYFVSSEKKCFNDLTRVWSVRKLKLDGSIETIESQISTKAKAESTALRKAYYE